MRFVCALLIVASAPILGQEGLTNPPDAGQKSAEPNQSLGNALKAHPPELFVAPGQTLGNALKAHPPELFVSPGPLVKLAPEVNFSLTPAAGGVCSIPLLAASPKAATVPMPNPLTPPKASGIPDKIPAPGNATTIDKMRVVVPAPSCATKITILPTPGARQ